MPAPGPSTIRRFGEFELDLAAGELRRRGRRLKLQPQPFKLLVLLTARAGQLISRDEIRQELWSEGTFVDFDQAVNFTIKQIRDTLQDAAERPLYIETVPRRGYRFIAPIDAGEPVQPAPIRGGMTSMRLNKALWANIAELRMAERRRRQYTLIAIIVGAVLFAGLAAYVIVFR
ncbi:MAG TPA: winged helix-turn-helix domain-containing protein [Vicinamibacterales bacterium]|nr:winged helix-turn-helix domain-containing protein [Vicinamibacterales bacterium]